MLKLVVDNRTYFVTEDPNQGYQLTAEGITKRTPIVQHFYLGRFDDQKVHAAVINALSDHQMQELFQAFRMLERI